MYENSVTETLLICGRALETEVAPWLANKKP